MEKQELIKDFIDLHKLPIHHIKNLQYAEYAFRELNVFEDWIGFTKYVEDNFGSKEEYRRVYGETKELLLKYTKSLPEFQAFNTQDMSRFKFDVPECGINNGNQYTESNVGKVLLSIDLKKANWQALKYCGVFKDIDTYEDLIGKFTDISYLIKSKYLRSVVFGQLNPGRHITVESYLINMIRPEIPDNFTLVCMMNDELIYEVPQNMIILQSELDGTEKEIKDMYGLDVSAEYYKLNLLTLESDLSNKQYKIYEKKFLCGNKINTYKCIPHNLWLIFNKLIKGRKLCDYDTWIEHDGVLSKYIENFKLIREEG
jgi:hypothetical protein